MSTVNGYITGNGDPTQTLVVVFLRGGADGLNMVAPVEDDGYYRLRPQIGIPKDQAVLLDGLFGLNPALAPLAGAYQDGDLLLIHSAGTEDETRSHFEAQDYMEHGGNTGGGWLGRYLRHAPRLKGGPLAAIAIGTTQPEVLRGAPAAVVMESLDTFTFGDKTEPFLGELQKLYAAEAGPLGDTGLDVIRAVERIRALRQHDYIPERGADYPDDGFGDGMRRIAQLIKANLGVEAACINLDGWDSHFASDTLMDPLMRSLSEGLMAFRQDLGPRMEQVTVLTMTEFGRRAYENASFGTDHGHGGVMFVMGGGVHGGRILHGWRGLDHGGFLVGPGDVPVIHNYRDVLAPVMVRHGGMDQCEKVFPGFVFNPVSLYA